MTITDGTNTFTLGTTPDSDAQVGIVPNSTRLETEIGTEMTSGARIKQQIAPGLRYTFTLKMTLSFAKTREFLNFIKNVGNDVYVSEVVEGMYSELLEDVDFPLRVAINPRIEQMSQCSGGFMLEVDFKSVERI